MKFSVSLMHDTPWIFIIKADWSITKSRNKLKSNRSKEASGAVLAAEKSEWSLISVKFISVYMQAVNDDLTLSTSNITWHINNKFR